MSRLTRDGTAEPVSRDQILRHARGQRNIIFPVQLTTSRIGNLTRLIHTVLCVMTIHNIYTYILTYRCSYTLELYAYTAVNRARMYMSPNTKYTGTWYTNQYKQQYCTSTYIDYALTTDTADHEQVWKPYAIDPYYSAVSKWWPYLLALYINTDHQQ